MAAFPIECENSSQRSLGNCNFPALVSHLPMPPCLRGRSLYAKAIGSQQITTNQFDVMGSILKHSYIFSKNNHETESADYVAMVGTFFVSRTIARIHERQYSYYGQEEYVQPETNENIVAKI